MSPILATSVPTEMIQECQSSAVSSKLDALLAEVACHFEATASKTRSEMTETIAEIRHDCASAGWDGYDANPIGIDVFKEAELLMTQIPYSVSLPHVAPAPSGAIAFEWRRGKNNILMITVSGTQKIAYAAVIDGVTKIHGVETFIESVSPRIESLLVEHFRATT